MALGVLLGIAVDSAGNVYFVDRSHSRSAKSRPTGSSAPSLERDGTNGFIGDGGSAAAAALNNPVASLATRQATSILRRCPPGRIRKITVANGNINTVAGGGTLAPGNGVPPLHVNINPARAVAVNRRAIFILCAGSRVLIKFAANGDSSYVSSTVRNTCSWRTMCRRRRFSLTAPLFR